jgi:phospholipase C
MRKARVLAGWVAFNRHRTNGWDLRGSEHTLYGYAPWIGPYGVPSGFSQPDGHGEQVRPFHLRHTSSPDIGHSWDEIHREWNFGRMEGFYTTDGRNAHRFGPAAPPRDRLDVIGNLMECLDF